MIEQTNSRLSAWQLTAAAYRMLRGQGRDVLSIATVPTLIALGITAGFSWLATGHVLWGATSDFTPRMALLMIVYGVLWLWISGLIFDRWTRHVLGTGKPMRSGGPTFWPSWVLAYLVLGIVFMVTFTISSVVLAPARSAVVILGISMPLAWIVSNLAAARLFLKASLRAGSLTTRPVLSEFILQDWSRSGWAYALAPVPILLGGFLIGKLADAIGGWVWLGWHLIEPVSGTITTLLVAGVGLASIRSSMARAVYEEPAPV